MMNQKSEKKKVLIIEDEYITASALKVSLKEMGFDVVGSEDTGQRAVKAAGDLNPDIVLMDIILKGEMNGITAANIIRQRFDIPVIYLTGQADDVTITHALESEPFGYILKPFEEKNLKTSITMALYKHGLDKKLIESEKRYRAIAELAEDSIHIFNPDYSIDYINTYGAHFFKISHSEGATISMNEIFPTDLEDQIRAHLDTVFSNKQFLRATMHSMLHDHEFWLETIFVPIVSGEGEVAQVIALSRDITIRVLLDKEMEKKGIMQIEQNMEQFQILNDQIRNPLAIIMSAASLQEGKESEIIAEQVRIIDDLVTQLDHGWVESEKVRSFLLKHYGHGKKI
ncbi:MAG: response regulator [Methanobacteriota archaeon]